MTKDTVSEEHPAFQKAQKLLSSPQRSEGTIQKDITLLLDALDIESVCQHRTKAGAADIFCPNIRTIFEVKALGKAEDPNRSQAERSGESQKDQLDRYVSAEIEDWHSMPHLVHADSFDPTWIGILTDGKVWHVWKYETSIAQYETDTAQCPEGQRVLSRFRPRGPKQLLEKLRPILLDENRKHGKPLVPENPTSHFQPFLSQMNQVFQTTPTQGPAGSDTRFSLWQDMLRASGMEPENHAASQDLFVQHSLLIAIARGVIHTLEFPDQNPDPQKTLKDGFVSWMLATLNGKKLSKEILENVHKLEWRYRQQDVLRNLYEKLIPSKNRKIFGETYTPDWLAEWLADGLLNEKWVAQQIQKILKSPDSIPRGVGVLDPACGSGTFLYYAIQKIKFSKALQDQYLDPSRQAEVIATLVHGIDVHPIAAEISRATVMRALPAIPPNGKDTIKVFQGDALMSMRQNQGSLLDYRNSNFHISTPGGTEIKIPLAFARSKNFAPDIRRIVESAQDPKSTLPAGIGQGLPAKIQKELKAFHKAMTTTIQKEGNSVWAWYIINSTAPHLLSEQKVSRILANPPWVVLNNIQVQNRKRAIENLFKETDLHTGGMHATNQDIAQLFVHHCRNLYLEDPNKNPAIWITNNAILKTPAWKNLRKKPHWKKTSRVNLAEIPVFSGAKAVVILEYLNSSALQNLPNDTSVIEASKKTGANFKEQYSSFMSMETALELIEFQLPQQPFPSQKSDYEGRFSSGTTIFPEVLIIISEVNPGKARNTKTVTTSPSRHMPWKVLDPQTGEIPLDWVLSIIKSDDMFPFSARKKSTQAIIPVGKTGDLHPDPCSVSSFWKELDEIYRENVRKGKATPKTLLSRINYQKALDKQISEEGNTYKTTVCYPGSGSNMRGARIHPQTIVNHKLYKMNADTEEEALYLTALLNAPCLQKAFSGIRDSDRDFGSYPWSRIPISKFDSGNPRHTDLSKQALQAEILTEVYLSADPKIQKCGQQKLSKMIKKELVDKGVLQKIDQITRQILPNHTT